MKVAEGSKQDAPDRELFPGLGKRPLKPMRYMVKTKFTTQSVLYNTAGTFILLNGLVRGSTDGTRVGRRIKLMQLHYKGQVMAPVATGTCDALRMVLVYDRGANGALPGATDVLQEVGASALSPWTMDNKNYEARYAPFLKKGSKSRARGRKALQKFPDLPKKKNQNLLQKFPNLQTSFLKKKCTKKKEPNTVWLEGCCAGATNTQKTLCAKFPKPSKEEI